MATSKFNYTALADFLSSYPEVLAIKRFRELQIRNLLFYQAELAHLEAGLRDIESQDAQQKQDPSEHTNFRWTPPVIGEKQAIGGPASSGDPTPFTLAETANSPYIEKVLQIRRTLAKYNEAVEQYKRLNAIAYPKKLDMVAIHEWLNDMNLGGAFLAGDVEDVWTIDLGERRIKAAEVSDFYGFDDQSGVAFRIGSGVSWLHRLVFRSSGNEPRQPHHIDTSVYGPLDQAITTIVASVLPILPIVVFYFVTNLLVRIGLIIAFTAVFSAVLVVGLQIEPHATLAITTAIAAIQVVYVGATAGDNK
ncbi:hypothetical protein FSARC_14110 [Fusarium sarcochroum]|uniref:DUF6594 domain-containing protein n=1 Tax=Fusarium sarcochroum TaxID=1208366 RepID=A0A8H4SW62_9HYPO|nr:hypothetical protein FSARC_14110 [Fusarium sarcochroum]